MLQPAHDDFFELHVHSLHQYSHGGGAIGIGGGIGGMVALSSQAHARVTDAISTRGGV